jgi:hypothetical protein
MWVKLSLRTRSPVHPSARCTYIPTSRHSDERASGAVPGGVDPRTGDAAHVPGCTSAAPRPIHLEAGLAWGAVSNARGMRRNNAGAACRLSPHPNSIGLPVRVLYLFDCPLSGLSGRRAPTRSVHICCKSRLSSASPAAARPTDRPGAAPPREGRKIALR